MPFPALLRASLRNLSQLDNVRNDRFRFQRPITDKSKIQSTNDFTTASASTINLTDPNYHQDVFTLQTKAIITNPFLSSLILPLAQMSYENLRLKIHA